MKNISVRFYIFSLVLLLCFGFGCKPQEEKAAVETEAEDDLQMDRIPKVVMDALKAKFPKAEIQKWTEEKEGDIVLYDIEFLQRGRKFEADIKQDGTIHNWEREIPAKELPSVVRKAVEARYRQASLQDVMAITAVKDGKEALEGYEIVLETAGKKVVEVSVAPDGKILEDSGEKK